MTDANRERHVSKWSGLKSKCRACHYDHHNECEDDRCACR